MSIFCLTSCNVEKVKELESRVETLESENEELKSQLQDSNDKLDECENAFEEIKGLASDGYDAISYFNWSQSLQDALDAFDDIQSRADEVDTTH